MIDSDTLLSARDRLKGRYCGQSPIVAEVIDVFDCGLIGARLVDQHAGVDKAVHLGCA
jgi:hypothetical protein